MSQMACTVPDADRAMHTRRYASFVDLLVPALSDDPETIAELQYAMRRFVSPEDEPAPLAGWARGDCEAPFDARICIVDLPTRQLDEFSRRPTAETDVEDDIPF